MITETVRGLGAAALTVLPLLAASPSQAAEVVTLTGAEDPSTWAAAAGRGPLYPRCRLGGHEAALEPDRRPAGNPAEDAIALILRIKR